MRRIADDPNYLTPPSEEVGKLADQIDAAIHRLRRLQPRISWLETQVRVQSHGAPHAPPEDSDYAP